jgi:hypothetical protein
MADQKTTGASRPIVADLVTGFMLAGTFITLLWMILGGIPS